MAEHLFTNGPPPPEYVELFLCRDIYHCTPVELAQVPLRKVLAHLTCLDEEAKQRERELNQHGK